MTDREGQMVPNVTFKTRNDGEFVDMTSDDIFRDKTVVVFALPVAFTPTRSSTHSPHYKELAGIFKKNGVDDIVCISVNDAFVMDAWKRDQKVENVNFVPGGNGEFTLGMGMLVDKSDLGFGKHSWRYSMLIKDRTIQKLFIEPDVPSDPFELSDADTMQREVGPLSRRHRGPTLALPPTDSLRSPSNRNVLLSSAAPGWRASGPWLPGQTSRDGESCS